MTEKTFQKYCLVIDEWFNNGFNGVQAYRKFYPRSKEEAASVRFNEIVRNSKIENYISEKREEAKKALRTTHEVLLEELENWAYSDITETLLLSPEQVKQLPESVRRLITKFETTTKTYQLGDQLITETTVKLWFVSKEKAMEMIHKHTGFYAEHNFQKNPELSPEERRAKIKALKEKGRKLKLKA